MMNFPRSLEHPSSLLAAIAVGSFALVYASSSHAEEVSRDGPSLGAIVGVGWFAQAGHAPPLCCGERDEWSVVGPKFGVRGGRGFGEHFAAALEVRFGVAAGSTSQYGGDRDNVVRTLDGVLSAEARIPVSIAAIKIGVGGVVGHAWGEFSPPETSASSGVYGLQLRLGVELNVTPTLAIGLEGSATQYVIVHRDFMLAPTLTWYPGWGARRDP